MTMLALLMNPVGSGTHPENFGLSDHVVITLHEGWDGTGYDACRAMITRVEELLREHMASLADEAEPIPDNTATEFRAACFAYLFSKARREALDEVADHVDTFRTLT